MALVQKAKKKVNSNPIGWLTKMDPEVKKLWVLGLKSKLYFQGDVHLRKQKQDVDRYCPYGVLCDLYAQEVGVEWQFHKETANYSMHGQKHLLPIEVAEWAGLRRHTCLPIIKDGEKMLLIDICDMEQGYDFEQIAEVINKCF